MRWCRRRKTFDRRWWAALALVLALLMAVGPDVRAGEAKSSTFRLEVPAGGWKGARFTGLPAGGSLSVRVAVDGSVRVLLLDAEAYGAFPGAEHPLFLGVTGTNLGFSVKLPIAGEYYLVLDNRGGGETRRATVFVRAAAP